MGGTNDEMMRRRNASDAGHAFQQVPRGGAARPAALSKSQSGRRESERVDMGLAAQVRAVRKTITDGGE